MKFKSYEDINGKDTERQGENCELVDIWEVLGRRCWSLLILRNLSSKEIIRFNTVKRLLTGVSSAVLSDRLLDLEREGLLSL